MVLVRGRISQRLALRIRGLVTQQISIPTYNKPLVKLFHGISIPWIDLEIHCVLCTLNIFLSLIFFLLEKEIPWWENGNTLPLCDTIPTRLPPLLLQDLKIKHRDMDAGRLAECCNERSRFRIGQVGERKEVWMAESCIEALYDRQTTPLELAFCGC